MMKKTASILLTLLMSLSLMAQGQVSTRKYRLSDFLDKMTKVVMSGDEVLCSALRQEVVNVWTSTTFEFCSLEQFEKLKTSENYYFLIPVESEGLMLLTLVKGGAQAAKGISAMHEVVSLPISSALGTTSRDLIYLGGIVQGIQDFTLAAMESEKTAYMMSGWFNTRSKLKGKEVYVAQEDLSSAMKEKDLHRLAKNRSLHIVPASEADDRYQDFTPGALVGYVIAPALPENGNLCYKLFFEADTHRLCRIAKEKITEKKGEGFLPSDLAGMGK